MWPVVTRVATGIEQIEFWKWCSKVNHEMKQNYKINIGTDEWLVDFSMILEMDPRNRWMIFDRVMFLQSQASNKKDPESTERD